MVGEALVGGDAKMAAGPRRGGYRPRSYAIVEDRSAGAYFILETSAREWQGPYASRLEAELVIAAWLT